MGFPFTSFHGARPWKQDFEWDTRLLGVLFAGKMPPDAGRAEADETEAGRTEANGPEAYEEAYGKESPGREEEDILYLAINTYWEAQEAELPRLTQGWCWRPLADTSRGADAVIQKEELLGNRTYIMNPRSVCIFQAKKL